MTNAFVLLLLFATSWASVAPVTVKRHFDDAASASLVLSITSRGGRALYTLSCYGQNSAPDREDFLYSGDFECRLIQAARRQRTYSTLLTEDAHQSRDWESRGRFFWREIAGECGKIPQYGREREFLLRGVRLTLSITEPEFAADGQVKTFTLTVSVQNDLGPDAQGEIAATPTIDRRWTELPCKLDNSSTGPHLAGR